MSRIKVIPFEKTKAVVVHDNRNNHHCFRELRPEELFLTDEGIITKTRKLSYKWKRYQHLSWKGRVKNATSAQESPAQG